MPSSRTAMLHCLAGLGNFGINNMLLTPEFGPRVRFASILTSAEIEPDPVLEKPLCIRCQRCVEACPVHALDGEDYPRGADRQENLCHAVGSIVKTVHLALRHLHQSLSCRGRPQSGSAGRTREYMMKRTPASTGTTGHGDMSGPMADGDYLWRFYGSKIFFYLPIINQKALMRFGLRSPAPASHCDNDMIPGYPLRSIRMLPSPNGGTGGAGGGRFLVNMFFCEYQTNLYKSPPY